MCDTVNTTTVVVSFWTFVYDMLIYYKTWIYQYLIMQVKSPSICSRVPEPGSDPLIGSGRESGRDTGTSQSGTGTTASSSPVFAYFCIVKLCIRIPIV